MARARVVTPATSTCARRLSGMTINSKPASGRGGRNKNEMVEHRASSFPYSQPVHQGALGSTAQAFGHEGGSLRALFGLCREARERSYGANIGQKRCKSLSELRVG